MADIDSSALGQAVVGRVSGILNVTAGAGVTGNGSAIVTIAAPRQRRSTRRWRACSAYTGSLNFNSTDTLTVATSDGTAVAAPTRSRSLSIQ